MSRDPGIQKIFEIADDSLQGVLGYHLYVLAMQKSSNSHILFQHLPDNPNDPNNPVIPHTFSWARYYKKEDLIDAMKEPFFELFQSRISLIAMVSVFEVALDNFIKCLNEKGHKQPVSEESTYKKWLKWAYKSSLKCDIGDKKAIERLSTTYPIIDNARRLRNSIVHNQGVFTKFYKTDAIKFDKSNVELHELYKIYEKNPQEIIPIVITTEEIIKFSEAHIEVLHILHNYLQKEYFGFPRPYVYKIQNKPIEWNKALWGQATIRFMIKRGAPNT